MILGTEARVRPMVELVERGTGPTAPFDPWQPVSSRVTPSVDSDEETYAVASESM